MPFCFKSAFTKGALSLVSLTAISITPGILAESAQILDLSSPFPEGNPINEDAAFLTSFITSSLGRDTRRFLVIENGEIVMDYQRDNVYDDEVFEMWSATKATMSMIIGTIMYSDQYNLSFDDTLGAILPAEAWAGIQDLEELAFKQGITINEMLTMTSGLYQNEDIGLFLQNLGSPIANSAGTNLTNAVAVPLWNTTEKGNFNYMITSNVLSYVIVAVTGMTPFEYCSVDVFPYLGIDPNKIKWSQNNDGVESSFSGLQMTAKDMAKIAQLYLQKGLAAPNKRLLSEAFVQKSFTEQTRNNLFGGDDPYGLLWSFMAFNKTEFPTAVGQGIWCGSGFMGQAFCFNYEAKRIVAYQRSNTVWDIGNWDLLTEMGEAAFSANFTFNETIESVASGALSHSVLWGPLAKFTLTWIAFWL